MESLQKKAIAIGERVQKFIANASKTGKDKRNEEFLTARVQLLENYWSAFCNINDELVSRASAEEMQSIEYFTKDTFSEVECEYIASLGWLNEQLKAFQPRSNHNDSSILNSTVVSTGNSGSIVKLPRINLPTFSGSYSEWTSFHDTFIALIHENSTLSDVQKMHYLKSSITGEAAKLLRHFSVTSANYESAWKTILERFQNKRLLVNSNLQSIISLTPMAGESSSELSRVLDNFCQSVRILENLSRPVGNWDDWLVYFLCNKLDSTTRKDWETSLDSSTEMPTFHSLKSFLEARLHALSFIRTANHSHTIRQPKLAGKSQPYRAAHSYHAASTKSCFNCKGNHILLFCPHFRAKSIDERAEFLRKNNICMNCMRAQHTTSACPSNNRCQRCHQLHHTMIHKTPKDTVSGIQQSKGTSIPQAASDPITSTTSAHLSSNSSSAILLATAVVLVASPEGRTIKARALLDQGSESNFISKSLANLLNLPKREAYIAVLGVGQCEAGTVRTIVTHEIISTCEPKCRFSIQSLVLPTLTQFLPSRPIHRQEWPHLDGLTLADPDFAKPSQIDLILGAAVYANILLTEVQRGPQGSPIAQATLFGWILSGHIGNTFNESSSVRSHYSASLELSSMLKRFWEIEEPPASTRLTPEETECEEFFRRTHRRDDTGRFIVRLPLRCSETELGSSRNAAMSSLLQMERRFERNPVLHQAYSDFIAEYLNLGHMELVPAEQENMERSYYLPHHAVLKPSSTTTKLRVVFNASLKTSTGKSLNDILHVGPKLQTDVSIVLMKWRFFPYVLTADAEKIFRQIVVDKADADLQRILWRSNPNEPIKTYRLKTVTYGTASAPYLACKVLHQLAEDHSKEHPTASVVLKEHFYVDDALFGAYDLQVARNLRDEICILVKKGGFHLRKWLANFGELLEGIPTTDREQIVDSKFVSDAQIKALGIMWNPAKDVLSLHNELSPSNIVTKRSVLADTCRIYDPLGWFSPLTIRAKLFLQQLWMNKLDWDEILPLDLKEKWVAYKEELQSLKNFQIQRWIGTTNSEFGLELHGFCDASLRAYGAVVYLRIIHNLSDIQVSLIASKTRVSPLKTVSLPRLELCGATLLSELMCSIQQQIKLDKVTTHLWTDSSIVLAWLREHPSKWTVFVANRVALIHEKMPNAIWHHISSHDNPADCITKGISATVLDHYNLWWSGPSWLSQPSRFWPQTCSQIKDTDLHEEKRPVYATVTKATDPGIELLYRYSSLQKLLRITAYCYRFVYNCRSTVKRRGTLNLEEISFALQTWIKLVQRSFFDMEIKCLLANKSLPSRSNLKNLNPVIDSNYVLRVGGRLRNSLLPYEEKCPVILPKTSQLTKLIIDCSHNITLHGGIQATLQHIRLTYWIIKGRSTVRQFVRNCVTCFRHRATTKSQIMADLPSERVRPAKPFLHSGADYAGPITIKPMKGRGRTFTKTYVALFICLVTRAVHLELVFNLTTEAFLSAFRRFISRRGRCAKLYTDNATYFTSADKELNQFLQGLRAQSNISELLVKEGTEWHFIPPGSPHFGGIWEAGIKAFKYHFRRIVGCHTLDLEEILTLITQIEACLNSRPLQPLTDDPSEMTALTPGHFLVGESLLTIPTPSTLDMPINRLKRWQLVQMMLEQLWHRWRSEYIHHLQLRKKWQKKEEPVKIDDLVLIKDERAPPASWLLGRVIEVHPGADNQIRVVTIKHKNGVFKRAISKICVLPSES